MTQLPNQTFDLYPATPHQERMWLAEVKDPGSPIYNVWCAFRVVGNFQPEAWIAACADVQARHEPLRTTFLMVDSQLHQCIRDNPAAPDVWMDFDCPDLETAAINAAQQPFDLTEGPVWRSAILADDAGTGMMLIISVHHIAIDGESLRVLLADLSSAYHSRLRSIELTWPELDLQYADFADWFARQDRASSVNWWVNHLSDHAPAPALPLDALRVSPPSPLAQGLRFELTHSVAAGLRNVAESSHTSVTTVMLAAWSLLLAHHSDQRNLLLGVPTAGRSRPETAEMVGVFVNTVPIRVQVTGDSFAALLRACRNELADAYDHQDAPLESILGALASDRDPARTPLFDTLFTAQNTGGLLLELTDATVTWHDLPLWLTRHDLELNVWDGNLPHGLLVLRKGLFTMATAQGLLDGYCQLLSQIAAGENRISALEKTLPSLPPIPENDEATKTTVRLLRAPGVVDARTVSVSGSSGQLVSFVVCQSIPDEFRLREHLGDLNHQVAAVVPVAALPVLGSGRLNLSALGSVPVLDGTTLNDWPKHTATGATQWRMGNRPASYRPTVPWPKHLAQEAATAVAATKVEDTGCLAILDGGPALPLPAHQLWECLTVSAAKGADITLIDSRGTVSQLTCSELAEQARRVAGGLIAAGTTPTQPLVVAFEENRDLFPALWAGLLTGNPVVPWNLSASQASATDRCAQLTRALGPYTLLLAPGLDDRVPRDTLEPPVLDITDLLGSEPSPLTPSQCPDDIALLLLTSGSTGIPKAVQLTHRMILHRSIAYSQLAGLSSQDKSLNWMPLDHVGGVVMFHLRDIVLGADQVHAATGWVLADPLRWMELVDEYRITSTWAPNFAEGLVADEAHRLVPGQWDLSCLCHVLNGGEAVLSDTVRRFVDALAPQHLNRDAVRPSWGMSETTSGETDAPPSDPASWTDPVPLGPPAPGFQMRIVDENGHLMPMGGVGALEVHGPSVTPGYWNNPERNAEAFTSDGWFRTGDQATFLEGQLHIVGRAKEEVIVNGVNVSCELVEQLVETHCPVVPANTVAVGLPVGDSEQLLVVAVPQPDTDQKLLIGHVRSVVQAELALPAHIALVTADQVPRTNIGKRQRILLRDRILTQEVVPLADTGLARDGGLPSYFHTPFWRRQERAAGTVLGEVTVSGSVIPEWLEDIAAETVSADNADDRESIAVLYLPADRHNDARSTAIAAVHLAHEVRRWVLTHIASHSHLVVVASGSPQSTDSAGGVLPGLVRTLAQENDTARLRLIHEDQAPPQEVIAEIRSSDPTDHVWLQANDRLACRISAFHPEIDGSSALVEGTGLLVITGGTSQVAAQLQDWLTARPGPIAVIGRRPVEQVTAWWPDHHLYRQADVTDPTQLKIALNELTECAGCPVDSVLHLAGEYQEQEIGNPDEDLTHVMWGKIIGAGNIIDVTSQMPGVEIILGSSVTGFTGSPGASGYAAANSYLNSLAQMPNVRVVAWSMWLETGMSRGYQRQERTADRGSSILDPRQASAMTQIALRSAQHLILIGLDDTRPWVRARTWPGTDLAVRRVEAVVPSLDIDDSSCLDVLGRPVEVTPCQDMPPQEELIPRPGLESLVTDIWSTVLGLSRINRTDSFFDVGGTSIQLSRVHGLLEEQLERSIRLVDLFQHHTVRAMARHLDESITDRSASTPNSAVERGQRRAQARNRRGTHR